jgi:hypothetical protein
VNPDTVRRIITSGLALVFTVSAIVQRYSGDHDLAAYLIGWACLLLLAELVMRRTQS